MSKRPAPQLNHVLAALPVEAQKRLFPRLELVQLLPGMLLCGSDDAGNVYFPVDSALSFRFIGELGAGADGDLGNEGVVGFTLSLAGAALPSRTVVKTAGSAYRLPGTCLKDIRLSDKLQMMQRQAWPRFSLPVPAVVLAPTRHPPALSAETATFRAPSGHETAAA